MLTWKVKVSIKKIFLIFVLTHSFGLSSGSVTVGGSACTSVSQTSQTQMKCTLPVGQGTSQAVIATVMIHLLW